MKYKVMYEIIMFFIGLMVSGYSIYIGVRQIRRIPFIMRSFSTRAGKVLPGVMIFSINTINQEYHMLFFVPTLCLLILFLIFLYIDYKKYYILRIYNIEEETLAGLLEEYFDDKDCQIETINKPDIFDSLYNEIRIYKSKSIKNISVLKRDLENYINHMKCKKFRVMGLLNILLGLAFWIFFIYILIKFHM